jgi:chorismate-pyruvate lyase
MHDAPSQLEGPPLTMLARAALPHTQNRASPSWAALLSRFYTRLDLPLPALEALRRDAVPEPYRRLLVHSSDMTPTLEGFYRRPMRLTVLSRECQPEDYLREVLLHPAEQPTPVEYGVIRIRLQHLPAAARKRVFEETCPLGNILQTENIAHVSWPQTFFRVKADSHLSSVLRLGEAASLYGRRNILLDGSRRLLADVMEVLAPVPAPAAEGPPAWDP